MSGLVHVPPVTFFPAWPLSQNEFGRVLFAFREPIRLIGPLGVAHKAALQVDRELAL
jgi:hypothetical protein